MHDGNQGFQPSRTEIDIVVGQVEKLAAAEILLRPVDTEIARLAGDTLAAADLEQRRIVMRGCANPTSQRAANRKRGIIVDDRQIELARRSEERRVGKECRSRW